MIFKIMHEPDTTSPESLADLPEGSTAVLGEFDLPLQVADQLMNLGFLPGLEVTAARSGPGGDPRVYRVDGTEVALRRELTAKIAVVPEYKTGTASARMNANAKEDRGLSPILDLETGSMRTN